MKTRGFTLIELLMVVVIMGIMAGALTSFLKPAIDSYIDTHRRADLTDIADTALRRMAQEIRTAVPNSVRSVNATCFQFVPTIAGGRYRKAIDTTLLTPNNSQALDTSAATTQFDVLSPMQTLPAIGDWVVVNNQNGNDVYAVGINRSAITGISTPSTQAGLTRLAINSIQFSPGYDGGRFVVVAHNSGNQTVFYNLVGTTLYRTTAAFDAVQADTCLLTTGAILATDVSSATFVYTPNQGATQQSGFVWMRLELSRSGDTAAMAYGVHVSNVP